MTLDEKGKQNLIIHRREKAHNTIDEVKFLLGNGMLVLAVNRIYYGMFYAVSALALKHGFTTSKHKQLIGWFNRRTAGDYDDWVTFSKEEVTSLFEGMKEFIHMVDDLL